MKAAAALALALALAGPADAASQESRFRLNPYAGWYHYDESSFEKGFDTSDAESDPIYGLRLALGGLGGWSLDLAYGRTTIAAEGVRDGLVLASDATIQLYYAALDWHLPLTGPLDLFVSGGGGGIDTDFDDGGGGTDLLLNYGIGVTFPLGSLRIRADLKDQVDFCDAPEDLEVDDLESCFEDNALHNIELTGGVEIPF